MLAAAERASGHQPRAVATGSAVDHIRALYVQTPATLTGHAIGMVLVAGIFWAMAGDAGRPVS